MTRSCVVIATPTVPRAVSAGRSALRRGSDLVELRLDHLRDPTPGGIRRLAAAFGRRGIATLRSAGQGGRWRRRRKDLLAVAAEAGFGFLDVEIESDGRDLGSLRRLASEGRTKIIASHHFLEHRPAARVAARLRRCLAAGEIGNTPFMPAPVSRLSAYGVAQSSLLMPLA